MLSTKDSRYFAGELMAAFLSRDIKDGEMGVFGTFSQIPWGACQLAKASHAPNLSFVCGPSGALNSKLPHLMWSVSDYRMHLGAEYRITLDWICDMQGHPALLDFGFYGGFQIDKFGNLNMAYIGDQRRPQFRGPGTVGTMATAWLNRHYLFTLSHSPRLLVDKVDFISGPGFIDGPGARERAGCPARSAGPRFLITPICVFDFDEETKRARLKSVHPGYTVQDVKERTGFKPIIPSRVPETEPPTTNELEFLRGFDPARILQKLC
jgi:glutaconate CoA-transferase, subunit B